MSPVDLERVGRRVQVLEADPDLASGLDESEREEAARVAVASVARLPAGTWLPPEQAEPGHMGFLVVDGTLTRSVEVGVGRRSVELLAPGDVLRPWVGLDEDGPADLDVLWVAMEAASLALLDPGFARRVAPWPQIASALMDRLVMRSRWLALDLAICQVRRVDDRLVMLFWQLARRFGKVTPEGVVIPLNLQHQVLAGLIGAQRPSVTTRLGVLRRSGLVARRPDGTWLLPHEGAMADLQSLNGDLAELTVA